MSESHHEYMMRTSQGYRAFIEQRSKDIANNCPCCGRPYNESSITDQDKNKKWRKLAEGRE
jgi:hypothetical protein